MGSFLAGLKLFLVDCGITGKDIAGDGVDDVDGGVIVVVVEELEAISFEAEVKGFFPDSGEVRVTDLEGENVA